MFFIANLSGAYSRLNSDHANYLIQNRAKSVLNGNAFILFALHFDNSGCILKSINQFLLIKIPILPKNDQSGFNKTTIRLIH